MNCNHCREDVPDSAKFCPYCGNRIEVPISLRCPQCNTEVVNGANYCPNCGSPVAAPQPRKCSECGAELEDGERFCSNCGNPVGDSPQPLMVYNSQQERETDQHSGFSDSYLNLIWDSSRKKLVLNKPVVVNINNQISAEFSPKEPFEEKYLIDTPYLNIQIEYGFGPFKNTDFGFDISPDQSYECTCFINGVGSCAYELTDSQGNLIKEDGKFDLWLAIIILILPILGFLYYLGNKESHPLSAKIGLWMGIGNLFLILLNFLF